MIDILIKLHTTDFVFYEVFLFLQLLVWYYMLFLDGADEMSQKLIEAWGESMATHPIFLKILVTLLLLMTLGGGYGIIINKIGKF